MLRLYIQNRIGNNRSHLSSSEISFSNRLISWEKFRQVLSTTHKPMKCGVAMLKMALKHLLLILRSRSFRTTVFPLFIYVIYFQSKNNNSVLSQVVSERFSSLFLFQINKCFQWNNIINSMAWWCNLVRDNAKCIQEPCYCQDHLISIVSKPTHLFQMTDLFDWSCNGKACKLSTTSELLIHFKANEKEFHENCQTVLSTYFRKNQHFDRI